MHTTSRHDQQMANLVFAKVYPLYVAKVIKKGRTEDELIEIITWLTGFGKQKIRQMIDRQVTFRDFFAEATLNPHAHLITGVICGYRVEEIQNPLTQKVRYLDKLVDELAKGKDLESILRKE